MDGVSGLTSEYFCGDSRENNSIFPSETRESPTSVKTTHASTRAHERVAFSRLAG